MPDGVDTGFAAEGLRGGGRTAADTAAGADVVASGIAGLVVAPEMFGQVDQAGPLAAVLTAARDGFRGLAEQVRDVHLDLSQQANATAGQGDQLVDATTALAARAAPSVPSGLGAP
jgi:hypothetical protein